MSDFRIEIFHQRTVTGRADLFHQDFLPGKTEYTGPTYNEFGYHEHWAITSDVLACKGIL